MIAAYKSSPSAYDVSTDLAPMVRKLITQVAVFSQDSLTVRAKTRESSRMLLIVSPLIALTWADLRCTRNRETRYDVKLQWCLLWDPEQWERCCVLTGQ